jgi:hypothetical protein
VRALLVLACVLACPATAQAATVSVDPTAGDDPPMAVLRAAPGEANVVTITHPNTALLTFRDEGAPLTAGAGCRQIGPNDVECDRPAEAILFRARVITGDGDDRVTGTQEADEMLGGAGDDVLSGEAGDDRLLGGRGDDDLVGGPGDDDMSAIDDNPRTRLTAADSGENRFDCGSGEDAARQVQTVDVLDRCEIVSLQGDQPTYELFQPRRLGAPVALLSPLPPCYKRCPIRIILTANGTRVGAAGFLDPRDGSDDFPIRLSPAGRALLKRRGKLTVLLSHRAPKGPWVTGGFRFVLRAP